MKMALIENTLLIKEADTVQFAVIKSWGKMKWSKTTQTLSGTADIELLDKLSSIVKLPPHIEALRQSLHDTAGRRSGAHERQPGAASGLPGQDETFPASSPWGEHGCNGFRVG